MKIKSIGLIHKVKIGWYSGIFLQVVIETELLAKYKAGLLEQFEREFELLGFTHKEVNIKDDKSKYIFAAQLYREDYVLTNYIEHLTIHQADVTKLLELVQHLEDEFNYHLKHIKVANGSLQS